MGDLALDLDRLIAIDVHTHAEVSKDGHGALSPELFGASETYFKAHGHRQPTIDEMAAHYRERRMAAVVFTVDAEHATGHPRISNEEIAESCAAHVDALIPFASIDPHKGRAGVREAHAAGRRTRSPRFQVPPQHPGVLPERPARLSPVRGHRGAWRARALPHRPDRHRQPACRAAAASG